MYREIVAAGFGGQGALMIGEILALAGIEENLDATWVPTYGQEKRGGDANASVIISSEEVALPLVESPDYLLSLNEKSIRNWGPRVKDGGAVFYNSSLIEKVDGLSVKAFGIPCNEIAKKIGSEKSANIVLLGAYLAFDESVKFETVKSVIMEKLGKKSEKIAKLNINAVEAGKEAFLEKYKK